MTKQPEEVKPKEEVQKVKIVVDFEIVWGFMWRWLAIILGFYIALFAFALLVGGMVAMMR